jgi:hypothetical protein
MFAKLRTLLPHRRNEPPPDPEAEKTSKGTLKDQGKRIKQLESSLKDMIADRKIADLKASNVYVNKGFFKQELKAVEDRFDEKLRALEHRISASSSSRVGPGYASGQPKVPAGGASSYWQREERPLAETDLVDPIVAHNRAAGGQLGFSQHATRGPEAAATPSPIRYMAERAMSLPPQPEASPPEPAPQAVVPLGQSDLGPDRRPRSDVSQLILSHFDEIDANSSRRLDVMKTMYKALSPEITDIEDHNGAYLFKIVGSDWFVHPRPNATLDHYWERAFPRAESYSRVIQRVTCLARIRRPSDQEYEVLREGSFVVR